MTRPTAARAARVLRVVGASTESWSDAAHKAIRMAADSLESEAGEDRLASADVGLVEYRVEVTVAFVGEHAHDDL
jgi:flavin-binding protein dodecin